MTMVDDTITAAGGFDESRHPRDTKGRFRRLDVIMNDLRNAGSMGSTLTQSHIWNANTAIHNGDRNKASSELQAVADSTANGQIKSLAAEAQDRLKSLKVGTGRPTTRGSVHDVSHPDHGHIGTIARQSQDMFGKPQRPVFHANPDGSQGDLRPGNPNTEPQVKSFRTRAQAAHHLAEVADQKAIDANGDDTLTAPVRTADLKPGDRVESEFGKGTVTEHTARSISYKLDPEHGGQTINTVRGTPGYDRIKPSDEPAPAPAESSAPSAPGAGLFRPTGRGEPQRPEDMSPADRADHQDRIESAASKQSALEQAQSDLQDQIGRTSATYGEDRRHWPASSEHAVSQLESKVEGIKQSIAIDREDGYAPGPAAPNAPAVQTGPAPTPASEDADEIDSLAADGTQNALDLGFDASTPEGESADSVYEAITNTDGSAQQKLEAGIEEANRLESDNPQGRDGALAVLRSIMHADGQRAEDAVPAGGAAPSQPGGGAEPRYPDEASAQAGMQDGLDEINRIQDGEWESTGTNTVQGYADGGSASVTRNPDGTYTAEISAVDDEGNEIASATHTYPADTSWPDAISEAHGAISPLWEEADQYGHTGRDHEPDLGDGPVDAESSPAEDPSVETWGDTPWSQIPTDYKTQDSSGVRKVLARTKNGGTTLVPWHGQRDKGGEPAIQSPPVGEISNADKIENAAKMYGHGSPQHREAIERFGKPKTAIGPRDGGKGLPGGTSGRAPDAGGADYPPLTRGTHKQHGLKVGDRVAYYRGTKDPSTSATAREKVRTGTVTDISGGVKILPDDKSGNAADGSEWMGGTASKFWAAKLPESDGTPGIGEPGESMPEVTNQDVRDVLDERAAMRDSAEGLRAGRSAKQQRAFRAASEGDHRWLNDHGFEHKDAPSFRQSGLSNPAGPVGPGDVIRTDDESGLIGVQRKGSPVTTWHKVNGNGQATPHLGPAPSAPKIAHDPGESGVPSNIGGEAEKQALRDRVAQANGGRSAKAERAFRAAREGDHTWLASHGFDAGPNDTIHHDDKQHIAFGKPDGSYSVHEVNGNGRASKRGMQVDPSVGGLPGGFRQVHDPAHGQVIGGKNPLDLRSSSGRVIGQQPPPDTDMSRDANVMAGIARMTPETRQKMAESKQRSDAEGLATAQRDFPEGTRVAYGAGQTLDDPPNVGVVTGHTPSGMLKLRNEKTGKDLPPSGFQNASQVRKLGSAPGATNVGAEANTPTGETVPTSDPARLTRLLPTMPSDQRRIKNSQAVVRRVHNKPLAQRTREDMTAYRHHKQIIDRFNETGSVHPGGASAPKAPAAEAADLTPTPTSSSAVAQTLKRAGIMTSHDRKRESVRVTGGGTGPFAGPVRISVDYNNPEGRHTQNAADAIEKALADAGYSVERDGTHFVVKGRAAGGRPKA